MAFWDFLKRPVPHAYFTPNVSYIGGDDLTAMLSGDMTPAEMWRTQPHLRTVVSFLARNIAQLGLHSFSRDGEDRVRDRTSPFAVTFGRPSSTQTAYELIYSLVGDLSLYDRAYWLIEYDGNLDQHAFRRLPPGWVSVKWKNAFEPETYLVTNPSGTGVAEVPADQVLAFTGYSPTSMRHGSPTVESLKGTLHEQLEAAKYRSQVWKRGGRVSAVIERPKDAPAWTDTQADRFREDWYANYTGSGKLAGGTPILEDGMTLNRIDFTAQEQQFVEASKLSFSTVASAFHVNPTMVGILDNANYSNVREFRRMLYGDTLGPLIAQIESRINAFLLPMLEMDGSTHYVEFNIAEKLQGSFEEQAAVMQTLVGRPIMTGDEGRSKFNLPALGGDMELPVTPLNILVGNRADAEEQADPVTAETDVAGDVLKLVTAAAALIRAGFKPGAALEAVGLDPIEHIGLLPITLRSDDGEKSRAQRTKRRGIELKADPPEAYRLQAERIIASHFRRQRKAVLSEMGAKSDSLWWDGERWDAELAKDLYGLSTVVADELGLQTAAELGFRADEYDPERTREFLLAVAESRARWINEATKQRLDEALAASRPPADVFDQSENQRSTAAGAAFIALLAGFALREAAAQLVGEEAATKTWVVTSTNPRPEHARMNGETVGLGEKFSNGSSQPGDPVLGADGVSGCECIISVTI